MKRAIGLMIGFFVLALLSCKDNSNFLTSSDQYSPPQLAAEHSDQILLKTRTGDGPLTERWITPVRWDGTSALLPGVVYRWNSYEEALAAYETRRPDAYRALKEIYDSKKLTGEGTKVKENNSNTLLAYSPTLYAAVWRTGDYYNGWMHAECSIDQPAPSSSTSIELFLAIDYMEYPGGSIDNLDYYDQEYYNNQDPHYVGVFSETQHCPATMSANTRLYVGSDSPYTWNAQDDDMCGW